MKHVSMRLVSRISSTLFLTFITVKVLVRSLTFMHVLHSWADLKQSPDCVFLCVTHSFFGGGNYIRYTKIKDVEMRKRNQAGDAPEGSPGANVRSVLSSFRFTLKAIVKRMG